MDALSSVIAIIEAIFIGKDIKRNELRKLLILKSKKKKYRFRSSKSIKISFPNYSRIL